MEAFIEKTKVLWEQKLLVDRLKAEKTEQEKILRTKKFEVLKLMQELGLDKQQVPGFGSCSITAKTSYKTPKTPEEKKALFAWIAETKGQDVLDNLLAINSQTLNSFAKVEFENAMSEENFEFSIPGLDEPTISEDIRFTKEKKK